jgi:hypothetical protein
MISNHIPIGRKFAITREELMGITGYDDRTIRKKICEERKELPIINLQNGEGYFIPKQDEKVLAKFFLIQEEHRLNSIYESLNGVRKFLDIEGKAELRKGLNYDREYKVISDYEREEYKSGRCQCGYIVSSYDNYCSKCGTRLFF